MSVKKFQTVRDVAQRLGVGDGKVLQWIASGDLKAHDLSQARKERPRWGIDPAEVERFLEARSSLSRVQPSKPKRRRLQGVVEFIT